jgi:Ca2+:H+ antiporter
MRWMLICVPVAFALQWMEASPVLVFCAALAAVIPLVEVMGSSTEGIAAKLGPTIGGLLNSSLNNLPEFIIGAVALSNGLSNVVKASLTGSILVNLLIGLGASLFIGGIKYGPQRFNRQHLRVSGSMLLLCAFCFIVPAMFKIGTPEGTRDLSTEIAVVLLVVYVVNIFVTVFGTAGQKVATEGPPETGKEEVSAVPMWQGLLVLAVAAVVLGLVSDILSEALEPTAKQLHLSDTFSGIVLLGGVGGIGEVLTAIRFARAGKSELVLGVTVGSTIQMVLLIAPLLVLSGLALGQPMNLVFTSFEVVSIVVAVLVARELIEDGRSNWLEGLLLLAMYLILAFGFYHLPDHDSGTAHGESGSVAVEASAAT